MHPMTKYVSQRCSSLHALTVLSVMLVMLNEGLAVENTNTSSSDPHPTNAPASPTIPVTAQTQKTVWPFQTFFASSIDVNRNTARQTTLFDFKSTVPEFVSPTRNFMTNLMSSVPRSPRLQSTAAPRQMSTGFNAFSSAIISPRPSPSFTVRPSLPVHQFSGSSPAAAVSTPFQTGIRSPAPAQTTFYRSPTPPISKTAPPVISSIPPSYTRLPSPWITSFFQTPKVAISDDVVVHCQITFENDFKVMLNTSTSGGQQPSRQHYGYDLGPRIARRLEIDEVRITVIAVEKHPDTGKLIVRFDINPALSSCHSRCHVKTSQVSLDIENLVNSFSFNISDIHFNILYVSQLPAFYSWTDDGPCPEKTCTSDFSVCNVRLTGEFYCDCQVSNCQTTSPSSLWALFVIPIVLIIIVIALLLVLIYNRRRLNKNVVGQTLRNYKPSYDVETLKQNPMLATLDASATNNLYKSLGEQISIAFNDRSFDKASTDSLISPFSTVRAHSSKPSSAAATDEDSNK